MNPRRAACLQARAITVDDARITSPRPGQVRIDSACTGIRGTDPHTFHGDTAAHVGAPSRSPAPQQE